MVAMVIAMGRMGGMIIVCIVRIRRKPDSGAGQNDQTHREHDDEPENLAFQRFKLPPRASAGS